MMKLPLLGAAAGFLCLGALSVPAEAGRDGPAKVCTIETHHSALVSRRGEPASERVLAMVEGNLRLFNVDIALQGPLTGEVTTQQMEIMRSVAAELGMGSAEPAPLATPDPVTPGDQAALGSP